MRHELRRARLAGSPAFGSTPPTPNAAPFGHCARPKPWLQSPTRLVSSDIKTKEYLAYPVAALRPPNPNAQTCSSEPAEHRCERREL